MIIHLLWTYDEPKGQTREKIKIISDIGDGSRLLLFSYTKLLQLRGLTPVNLTEVHNLKVFNGENIGLVGLVGRTVAHPHVLWEKVATMCLRSLGCAAGGQLLQHVGDLVEELGLAGDSALNSS